MLVYRTAGRDELVPLFVGEVVLHAFLPAVGLVVNRPNRMPHKSNDGAVFILLLGLVNDGLAVVDTVLAVFGKTKVLPPNGRVMPGNFMGVVGVMGNSSRVVMLGGKDALSWKAVD